MKRMLLSFVGLIILFYLVASIYYEYILPYPVLQGEFILDENNQQYIIEYNDPDISYRDLLVEIKNVNGSPIEIIYTKCSDEARIAITEGSIGRFHHNFAGNIIIQSLDPLNETNCSYKVIDRASLLVPKSASKACTDFSRFAFMFNLTIILFTVLLVVSTAYITVFKRDQLKKYFKSKN